MQYLKSNSCLLAVDSSPAFVTGEKRGVYFLGLAQNFEFSTSPARNQSKQIGTQEYGVDAINFSPDILANFSYLSTQDSAVDSLFGMVHRPSGDYQAVFTGINDFSHNVYLFISDLQSNDLIKQITDNQSFSGLSAISIGNCYLTNASLNFAASQLAKSSLSIVASNIKAETLSGNIIQIPAINLESGNSIGAANLILDPNQVFRLPTGNLTGVIPNAWSARFSPTFSNLQAPDQKLADFSLAHVNSIDISIGVDRENSYGFGSDHVYDRPVKFPIQGSLGINGAISEYNSGNFAELMTNEQKYDIQIFNRDPQDVYLSGLSYPTFTGINETGHIVKNRWLKFDNCPMIEKRDSFAINELAQYSVQFGFSATERAGYSYKQGDPTSLDDFYLRSFDLKRLISSDSRELIFDPFCRAYGEDCEVNTMLSQDGYVMCTYDNFVYDGDNPACYLEPSFPTGVFALYLSKTNGSSGSYVPFMGVPSSGQNGGYLQSGTKVFYNYSPSFAFPISGEIFDSTATGDLPNLFYRLGPHRFQYSGGYGMYNITYNMDSEAALSAPSITGSGYVSNYQTRLPFVSGNNHIVEFYKSADGTGLFTGIALRSLSTWGSSVLDIGVLNQSIYYYRPVGIRGSSTLAGPITGYPNPRTRPSGLYFDEGNLTYNEEGTLRWATGMKPAQAYTYNIYRSLSGVSPFSLLGSTTGLSYTDSTMSDAGTYIFRATVAINGFESPTDSSPWTWIESL